jgi:hypothetical protein
VRHACVGACPAGDHTHTRPFGVSRANLDPFLQAKPQVKAPVMLRNKIAKRARRGDTRTMLHIGVYGCARQARHQTKAIQLLRKKIANSVPKTNPTPITKHMLALQLVLPGRHLLRTQRTAVHAPTGSMRIMWLTSAKPHVLRARHQAREPPTCKRRIAPNVRPESMQIMNSTSVFPSVPLARPQVWAPLQPSTRTALFAHRIHLMRITKRTSVCKHAPAARRQAKVPPSFNARTAPRAPVESSRIMLLTSALLPAVGVPLETMQPESVALQPLLK